jgi:predicted nucleotidyltransferase
VTGGGGGDDDDDDEVLKERRSPRERGRMGTSHDDDDDDDAADDEPLETYSYFAHGHASEGRRSIAQLEAARVVRPVSRLSRLDDHGRVVAEDCAASAQSRSFRRTGGAAGRGGAAAWAEQWWAATEDAGDIALRVFNNGEAGATVADDDATVNGGMNGHRVKVNLRGPFRDAAGEDVVRVDLAIVPGGGGNASSSAFGGVPSSSRLTSDRITRADSEIAAGRVIGVYVRGSVARGEARAGVSDVDVVVVLWGHESADDVVELARQKRTLKKRLSSKEEWHGRWGHLATKADVRVVTVPPPPHPAGTALAAAIAGEPLSRQSNPNAAASVTLCLGEENTFVLAAECATVYGPDLPKMLPASARTPPLRCLPTLFEDVTEAIADGGETALKWALRHILRAAFEQHVVAGEACHVGGAAAEPGCGYYTRDLYHCAALVSDAKPELGEDLASALVAAVYGPRAAWGGLWWACGAATAQRLRDAVVYGDE